MACFDLILFDYDGTLFDTRPAIAHCIERAFERGGRPPPPKERALATIAAGLPLAESLVALDATLRRDRRALNDLITTYRQVYLNEGTPLLSPFAGVGTVLRRLRADGIKSTVISNKGIEAIRHSLDQTGFDAFVDTVFGDQPGLPKKPDPLLFTEHILPLYDRLPRDRILMVGDTESDILFAKSAGIPACWASYGYGETERCRRLSPEHEISSIVDLIPLACGARR
jgi:phosphoglycolate phosphatase